MNKIYVTPTLKSSLQKLYGCDHEQVDSYEISNISNDDGSFPFSVDVSFLYHRNTWLRETQRACNKKQQLPTIHELIGSLLANAYEYNVLSM